VRLGKARRDSRSMSIGEAIWSSIERWRGHRGTAVATCTLRREKHGPNREDILADAAKLA